MGVPVRRLSVFVLLALLGSSLVVLSSGTASASTPHIPINTDPTCPTNETTGDVIAVSVTDPCWVEYVSIDGVWVPALLIPPTDGTNNQFPGHPLPGPRVFSNRGLIWAHGGFDRSAVDGLGEYCGSGWSSAGGWNCGNGSESCPECPRWERMFKLAGLGYWILAPDYRDSGGHGGADVSTNAFDDIAGKDVDDVGLGADFLRDHVTVDAVILFGTSRGGWLAAGATYRYDDKVDAVGVISGGCDWISVYPHLSDGEKTAVQQSFGGPPNGGSSPPAYFARSACYHFDEMDKPILIMHGTTDASFPIGQARMFRDGLLATAGHPPLEYREYDAGHTFFWGDEVPFGTGHWVHFNSWAESILGTNTIINTGPPAHTQQTSATFTFSATGGATTFECRLDGAGGFQPCTSPKSYGPYPDGETHTFEVRALFGGVPDPTPAERTWTVDLTPPVTSITSGPTNPTQQAKAKFVLASNEPFPTYRCELDNVTIPQCISSTEYTGITQGQHTFEVWASDAAGNEDDTAAVYTWVMDTGPPVVSINSGPSGTVTTDDATFTFSANEPVTGWECQLDGGSYSTCTSPKSYTDLAGGSHEFIVKATDVAGNTGTKDRTWTIQLPVVPDTFLTQTPEPLSNQTSTTFKFASSPNGWPFECRLDTAPSGPWTSCTSPYVAGGLSQGSHTFEVRAVGSGGPDNSPASHTWTVDSVAPDTTIDSGPSGTSGAAVSFTFSSTETGSFQCKLDGSSWASCTSPKGYSGLSNGSHTFQVKATDQAGNVDPSQASRTWTVSVDTTSPNTTITGGPSGTVTSQDASFTFTSTEGNSTFECRLDGVSWSSCTSPKNYSGLSYDPHTFDVRATDQAGNTDLSPASRTWTVEEAGDTDPPQTTIDSGPSGSTTSTSASFTFSSDEAGSTFQCRLDGGSWGACASPKDYADLGTGGHTFEVKAKDAALNEDLSPASRSWTITSGGSDTTPPETIILTGPASPSPMPATFTFEANEAATIKCRLLDNALLPWTTCTSPYTFTDLPDGSYTFQARATDTAGNRDGSPASWTWTVGPAGGDTDPPDTFIDSGPSGTVASPDASFGFSSDEPGSTFECRLDGGGWGSCTSPKPYAGLPDGSHTFEVRATDPASNIDDTPAARTWTIATGGGDTDPPETTIDSGPANPTTETTVTFTFSSDEPGTFECKLAKQGTGWQTCPTPHQLTLSIGTYTLSVRARDAAGNADLTPASWFWRIVGQEPGPGLGQRR